MKPRYVPPSTQRELASPARPGGRHHQALKISFSLIAQGWEPAAVFAQLRPMYESTDFPDAELRSIISGAVAKKPAPIYTPDAAPADTPSTARESLQANDNSRKLAESLTHESGVGEADLWDRSPVRLDADWKWDGVRLLSHLYANSDLINVVTQSARTPDGKSRPRGRGTTISAADWIDRLLSGWSPKSDSGAWIRLNPLDGDGITDDNVSKFLYLLVESDALSRPAQLTLIGRYIPAVAAIIDSGGRSLHCWLKIDAADNTTYKTIARKITSRLAPLGFDPSNKNPSRLSRLPGVNRSIDGTVNTQRLLYLDPDPSPKPILSI